MVAALHPDDDDATVGGHDLDVLAEIRGPHDVEHHVGAAPVGQLAGASDEILGAIVDPRVGAKLDAAIELRGATGGHEDSSASLTRQLNRRRADAATAAVDEHRLAVLQPSSREERIVGGDEHLGDPTRVDQVDVGRNADDLSGAHRNQFGVPTAFDEEHDAIPLGVRGDPASNARDRARRLETEDVAGSGRWWIETLALEEIGAVDAGAGDADDDLTLSSDRVGTFLDVQLLGTAWRRDDDGAHAQEPWSGAAAVRRPGRGGTQSRLDRSTPDRVPACSRTPRTTAASRPRRRSTTRCTRCSRSGRRRPEC